MSGVSSWYLLVYGCKATPLNLRLMPGVDL